VSTSNDAATPERFLSGPSLELDWPKPVRSGIGAGEVNGQNRPSDAIESVRWLGWWVDPIDLVAWHPDDWAYPLHLADLVDARHALFIVTHVANRYHHPGPLAGDRTARWRLSVGFTVLLDEVLGIRDVIAQHPYRVPTAAEVRVRLDKIADQVATGNDKLD
jgi:hypothetical protein